MAVGPDGIAMPKSPKQLVLEFFGGALNLRWSLRVELFLLAAAMVAYPLKVTIDGLTGSVVVLSLPLFLMFGSGIVAFLVAWRDVHE